MNDAFTPKTQPTGDDEVGYKKPPKSGQWQEGQSGNPKGRPKHRLISDWAEAYHEAGQEIVHIPIKGKLRRMTLLQAEAFKARFDGASGDARARRDLIRAEEIYAQRKLAEGAGDREIICELVLEDDRSHLAEVDGRTASISRRSGVCQGITDWKVE